ncbi:MAG TPA: FAD-dependent oxidoreductase, partial [Arthrobacter sp.]|nr:FAD-dependent oxidoreductase [Arthrobacter sp.]
TVVDPNPYMTYQPLLPEVAGAQVEPRNVTVPLERALPKCTVIRGSLEKLEHDERLATVVTVDGGTSSIPYDHVVFALGAVTRVFPTPGLRENAVGFKTLEEAVYLRDRVLEQVSRAAAMDEAADRAKALSFVFVGGGYTGVEALGELLDLAKVAVDEHPGLSRADMRWTLVEALDRVAPEVGKKLAGWTLDTLRERGVDVRLETTMKSCENGVVELSDGEKIPAATIVWTAGVTPNPALDNTDMPRGPKGHVCANACLQVVTENGDVIEGAWAAGDNAQVPDLTADKQPSYYPPNAQNALRQAWVLGRNVAAAIRGQEPEEYRHESLGSIASYGTGRGAANIRGLAIKGRPAWLLYRLYHGGATPTVARKLRVFTTWLAEAFVPRDTTPTTSLRHPRRPFLKAVDAAEQQQDQG